MQFTAIFTAAILLLGGLGALVGDESGTQAWVQDKINNNKNETTLEFLPGGGQDDSTTLSLPQDAPVYNARIGVTGSAPS